MSQKQLSNIDPNAYQDVIVRAAGRMWAEYLISFVLPLKDKHILDIACGTGVVTRIAAKEAGQNGKVVGIDVTPDMIEVAKPKPSEGAQIEWLVGDAEKLPFKDESFDVVVCQHGLQFFDDKPKSLKEMHRVLKQGGQVAIMVWGPREHTPGFDRLWGAIEQRLRLGEDSPLRIAFSLHDPKVLHQLLEDAGFSDIKVTSEVKSAHFLSVEEFVNTLIDVTSISAKIPPKSDERLALIEEMKSVLANYISDKGLIFPMEANVAISKR